MSANNLERSQGEAGDIEPLTGQPIEEAEKNLSRHTTKDSSPPVEEQWRTSVRVDNEKPVSGEHPDKGEQVKE
jgi:hypothetical protein